MLKSKTHVKYTISELLSYVKDPNSSVHRITDRLHIGLSPAGLGNFQEAVVEQVTRSKVGQFDQKHNGIVLDVRNYKVLGNIFPIQNDDPQLHVDLNADLYVFQPTVGAIIKGVIKHIAFGHISVTVHRVFNVAIRLAGGKDGLSVNMEITIQITDFDLTHKLPFIEGVLHTQPKLERNSKKPAGKLNGEEEEEVDSTSGDSDEEVDSKAAVAQYLEDHTIKIKKEPRSDSSSASSNSSDSDATQAARDDIRTKKRLKREPSIGSSSSSGSDTEDHPVSVKREKVTSGSGSSSDSSDSETIIRPLSASVKKESSSSDSDSSSESDSQVKKSPAKRNRLTMDLIARVMAGKEKPASSPGSAKKRSAQDAVEKTPRKTKRMNESLANLSAFATPGLSSTMIPESEKKKKSKNKKPQ